MEGGTIYRVNNLPALDVNSTVQDETCYMQSMVYQTVKLFILQYSVLLNDATLSQQMLEIKYKTLRNGGKFNMCN